MKYRCAVLDDYQKVAARMADWTQLADRVDVTFFHDSFSGEEELAEALRDFGIIVAMRERTPFPASLFAKLPNLRLLVTTGMRNAAIDMEAAKARGVTVCGTLSSPDPLAELTWALILGLARHLAEENAAFRSGGPWQSTVGIDLRGKRMGIIGLGKIGRKVAPVGLAFGMDVTAWSQNLTREAAAEAGVGCAGSLEELLETSDVVTIHLVLSERTRNLIGREQLRRMKPDALLINTSRAAIVNREALIEALENGWIGGAGLDVFDIEPVPADDPLRRLPNVLCTPHLGYVTEDNYRRFYGGAVEDIAAYLAGAPIRVLS